MNGNVTEKVISFTATQLTKLDNYVEFLKTEYIKAGGTKHSMMEDSAIWYALAGILHREGEDALDEFIRNWKPTTPKRTRAVGYASWGEGNNEKQN